jgi:hypothetical protein
MDWDMTGDRDERGPTCLVVSAGSLYFDCDVDAVADHDTTALQGNVERHAKVAAVERPGRGEPGSLVAVRVGTEPVHLDPQRHLPGDPVLRTLNPTSVCEGSISHVPTT